MSDLGAARARQLRLAIVGSVSLDGDREAADVIEMALDWYGPTVVVSGGARGIDSMAIAAAKRRGIEPREYRPKVQAWLRGSPDGFWARNQKIAGDCDVLVRIVAADSKTYGSGWTRDRAKERGAETREVVLPLEYSCDYWTTGTSDIPCHALDCASCVAGARRERFAERSEAP